MVYCALFSVSANLSGKGIKQMVFLVVDDIVEERPYTSLSMMVWIHWKVATSHAAKEESVNSISISLLDKFTPIAAREY